MTETISLEDFHHFLSHVKDLYPYGVSESFVDLNKSEDASIPYCWGNGQVGVVFLVSLPSWKKHPFESEEGKLLHAAISKGMKIMPEHVSIIDSAKLHGDLEGLEAIFQARVPEVVIILGDKAVSEALPKYDLAKSGEFTDINGIHFLLSSSLEDVISSVEVKREFWGHLKKILMRLGDA